MVKKACPANNKVPLDLEEKKKAKNNGKMNVLGEGSGRGQVGMPLLNNTPANNRTDSHRAGQQKKTET